MSRKWAWLIGPLLLALLAIWQVPAWLDWTRYRTTIEDIAAHALRQPVSIRGAISLTLLPQPVLTAAQVSVGGSDPGSPSMHVEALRLRVALGPLLGGRIDASELVLRGPDLRIPWSAEAGARPLHQPAWLAAFAARIENGTLGLGKLTFTGVDATLATLDTGALSASGTAQFGGQPWRFTARLTAAGADGAAGLDVTLAGEGKAEGLGARFTGQLAADGTLAGSIRSQGPDLAVLLPAPAVPFRAEGRLTIGGGLVAVDDLALEIGGAPATAAVALRVAPQERLDIALSASRLDLDAWLPVLLDASTDIGGIDLPVGMDFSVESAPLGGGTLEHLRAAFDLLDRQLVVREASTRLPGNATLRLAGQVSRDPAHPGFEGDATLQAPVLQTTLRWWQQTMPAALPADVSLRRLPEGVLQRADLSAHLFVGNGAVSLRHIVGSVDDTHVAGDIDYRRGEPPTISANLDCDRLPLDPWLPTDARLASALNAALRLHVRQASVAGSIVRDLVVDGAISAGTVTLRRLEGTVTGAHVLASGILSADGKLDNGKLSVETANAAPLADMLPAAWYVPPALWQGPATLDVQAAGPFNALALGVHVSLPHARLAADPTIDFPSREWRGTVTATLDQPAVLSLVPQAWRASLGDGSLSLAAHIAGAPMHLALEQFELAAATLHAAGNLSLDATGSEPRVSGHVYTSELTLPPLNGMSNVLLPFDMLRGWRGDLQLGVGRLAGIGAELSDATASLSVADGRLQIDKFSAKLGSGSVSASFGCDAGSNPPAFLLRASLGDAAITGPLADAPIDLLSGQANGSLSLTANGYSPAAIFATLTGQATLAVTDGELSGFDMAKLNQAVAQSDPQSVKAGAGDALRAGTTRFQRLDIAATVTNGDISLDTARLTATGGEARFSGRVNLPSQALNVTIALHPALEKSPQIALLLSGPVDHPERTPELADLARWMAELVH